jgi:hypothetical protein
MRISHSVLRRLHCLHLPGALLIALLQRTPAVRLLASAGESALRHPAGAWLKSAAATLGALGVVHTLAGATTLSPSTPSPAALTAGTAKTIAFAAIGAQSAGESWTVGGSVPPGMTFNGGATSGTINTPNGILTLSGTPTTAGAYVLSLRAWEKAGAKGDSSPLYSYTINVTSGATATAPAFTSHPASQTVTAGASVTLTAIATGSPTPTLQWQKNGSPLPGQTGSSLTLTNVQPGDAGSYTCVASNAAATVTSNAASVGVSSEPAPGGRISNVSVRTTLASAQTLIVGFTMQGGAKPVVVRAVGPGLANFGVAGSMPDPRLLLYKETAMLTQNDNWGGASSLTNVFAAVGAFPLPAASLDSALMRTVEGGHTAQVSGPAGGNVLVEAYDAGTGASPRLSNISARNFVGTGGDILIAGFTIAGSGPKNLLIRAVGPTLGAFGVPGTLADPKVAVYNTAGTVVAENDSWSASLSGVFTGVGAFPLAAGSKDAAFTLALPPGGYTVQVSGADGGTGEALVEVYELP